LRVEDLVESQNGLRCKDVQTCRWRRKRAFDARQMAFDFEA